MSAFFAMLHFTRPALLFALLVLPALWWLLRVTPPAPRRQEFPAIRLLRGLVAASRTAARTPLWLLALRLLAGALVIAALAGPVLRAPQAAGGAGDLLLVIDDGWASAASWPARMSAASAAVDRAAANGRNIALLATAPGEDGAPPALSVAMPASEMRARLAALRPKPWPVDRAAAAGQLARASAASVVYIADGVGDDPAFRDALARLGKVEEFRAPDPPLLIGPPHFAGGELVATLRSTKYSAERSVFVLAQGNDGRTFARTALDLPAEAAETQARLDLPPELANTLTRLVLEAPPSAAGVWLLDETNRRRPVGLLRAAAGGDAPLIGPLYYVRRALEPTAELREGDLHTLLSRELSVLIVADQAIADPGDIKLLDDFLAKGGTLIRFAGPDLAAHPDALLPVTLLDSDRQLGGAMSWAKPPGLAAFDPASPFAGLAVPGDVHVTRQVLATPASVLPGAANDAQGGAQGGARVWARLADGTPLVTEAARGNGRIVLFHVTANADWSDLPLSGLFVDLLNRLVGLAQGVAPEDGAQARQSLPPQQTLDGFGQLGPPSAAALAIGAAELTAPASARHPPGFYGQGSARRAFNLGGGVGPLVAAPPVPGASVAALSGIGRETDLSPWPMAAALALLAVDMLIALTLRGLLRRAATAAVLGLLLGPVAAHAQSEPSNPALATRLAYIVTDDARDAVSRAGLQGLSDYVNRRTNAELAQPDAVVPGRDELGFYPLLYWPIAASDPTPDAAWAKALDDYMENGGIVVIDTRDAGSGEGFAPGASAALERIGQALNVPRLTPLTPEHVLAHAFYLLREFPGRYDGGTVWVQRDQDRTNDSVSPVIIGGNDWAAAWATDSQGRNPYATIPGGVRQRVLAYRFGVNLVMYALTGNYKGDQVHVPALLERLGQ
jgi:hypothetical protein